MSQRFEEIEHTADVAIRVWGRDLAELFANAAYGMACQLADPGEVEQTVEQSVELNAYDVETLLVSWLGELLYLGEREECVFTDFDLLEVTLTRLWAPSEAGPSTGIGDTSKQSRSATWRSYRPMRDMRLWLCLTCEGDA
jgi:hypothetical protein